MSRRINQINVMTQGRFESSTISNKLDNTFVISIRRLWRPLESDSSRLNRDSSGAFGRKEVRHRRAFINVPYPSSVSAIIEHTLCSSCLPGINMSDDSNIPRSGNVHVAIVEITNSMIRRDGEALSPRSWSQVLIQALINFW